MTKSLGVRGGKSIRFTPYASGLYTYYSILLQPKIGIPVSNTKPCSSCGYALTLNGRFCPKCGTRADRKSEAEPTQESLNLRILYIMVGLLILAVLFPPWQTPLDQPPEFLGFHFILSPPSVGALRSPILHTIQLFTIAVAGLYFSWAYRGKG
jgi:hypothetical protein